MQYTQQNNNGNGMVNKLLCLYLIIGNKGAYSVCVLPGGKVRAYAVLLKFCKEYYAYIYSDNTAAMPHRLLHNKEKTPKKEEE